MQPAQCAGPAGGCNTPSRCYPIWPSNTSNELLYSMQRLFSRDNHNHDQVLGEHTYNLPLMLPQNQAQIAKTGPFQYVDGHSGRVLVAPYSTDNIMHSSWVPFRLETNLSTPTGSDSDIYFDKVKPAGGYRKWQDWLDTGSNTRQSMTASKTLDQQIANSCGTAQRNGNGKNSMVCSQTCVDWFTNRIVNPQGSMMPDAKLGENGGLGGGCPFGTLRALTCYPCQVHNIYVKGSDE